jgi:hypothetical protein
MAKKTKKEKVFGEIDAKISFDGKNYEPCTVTVELCNTEEREEKP